MNSLVTKFMFFILTVVFKIKGTKKKKEFYTIYGKSKLGSYLGVGSFDLFSEVAR